MCNISKTTTYIVLDNQERNDGKKGEGSSQAGRGKSMCIY